MNPKTADFHDVKAVAGDSLRNLDFYEGVWGLRPVKKTVNLDGLGTYHLFCAEAAGRPGAEMAFFNRDGIGPTAR